jgi:hypothetical protein
MKRSEWRRQWQEASAVRRGLNPERKEEIMAAQFFADEVNGQIWYIDLATGEAKPELPAGAVLVDRPATAEEMDARELANRDAERANPALLAELEAPPALPWIAQVDDRIAGTVVGRYSVANEMPNSGNGDGTAEAIEIETASGARLRVTAYQATLVTAFRRYNPQPGDLVAIARLADVESKIKGHKPYQNYRVVVRRPR